MCVSLSLPRTPHNRSQRWSHLRRKPESTNHPCLLQFRPIHLGGRLSNDPTFQVRASISCGVKFRSTDPVELLSQRCSGVPVLWQPSPGIVYHGLICHLCSFWCDFCLLMYFSLTVCSHSRVLVAYG